MSSDTPKPSRQDQAAAWFAAERAGVMLVEQRAEFDAWRADPRNQVALDAMRELWDDLAILKGDQPKPSPATATRRLLPIGLALAIGVIGLVATTTLLQQGAATTISTVAGQQLTQSLPDGSLLAVNVASNVSYKVTSKQRQVTLVHGQAAFSVRADPLVPFVVRAGRFEVRAVGTAFDVRRRDGVIEVAVSEGRVEVCQVGGSGSIVLLTLIAGQKLSLQDSSSGVTVEPSPVSVQPAQVAEWRSRIVTYEDATVRDVVEDFNRYFDQKLLVAQPELLMKRVTIRLRVDDRGRAIETLARLLDAQVVKTPDGEALREQSQR